MDKLQDLQLGYCLAALVPMVLIFWMALLAGRWERLAEAKREEEKDDRPTE